MKHQLDNLFREKFVKHSLPAPEAAWSRIEKEIPAQRTKFFIWKVAAAFLLLLVSVALLIPTDKPTNKLAGNSEKSQPKRSLPSQKDPASDSIASKAAVKSKQESIKKKSETKSKPKKPTPIILNFSKQQDELAQTLSPIQKTEVVTSKNEITENNERTTLITAEVAIPEEAASTTIVIAASEANQKYLLPLSSTDATSSEKSASSFRKLLEKAEDLKTNATGFGELRQKKNELLALSSDRHRGRNEKNERNN